MSDPTSFDLLSDDQFRNRIAAALHELDQPETDADLCAALDAIAPEPLGEAAVRRIMRQVRSSVDKTSVTNHVHGAALPVVPVQTPSTSHAPMVAACAALLAVAGFAIHQLTGIGPARLTGQERVIKPHPGDLIPRAHQAVAATTSERVQVGDTVVTGPREKRRVTLPDGSVLSMNEQTKVSITTARRVKLLAGEVFVEVVPQGVRGSDGPPDQFVVETPRRQVTALGTKFVVKAEGPATNVVVTQGKVQVSGVEEVITAGQELIADQPESKSVELRPAKRTAYVVEWVKDLMAAAGSIVVPTSEHSGGSITVVDPQGQEMKLSLRKFHVDVHIEDGFARTTIDQTYFNHTWQQLEGTFRFPLPADASLSRLAMYVNGTLMEGGMVERDYGRNVFEQIRHTRRDPALLEWVDGSTFQMRVFPLEARQEKRILLSYTQRLPSDYGKSVYRFPSGHSLEGVREWSTHLQVKGAAGSKWYSPSHLLNGHDDNGDLIIDGREDYAPMDRDLVVEFGGRSQDPVVTEPSWSLYEQDGFKYVMLRQRPDLKGTAERPRRHWIFLVENSADRNDVLAETQRQVAKVLLENVEHSDSMSIIRAGTQAEAFRDQPVDCSLDNVEAALKFLNEVAPIGALDLGQALQTVQQHSRTQRETWFVHLGTGIPVLGERDQTTLSRLVPAGTRYVGVAVGKRWSKSFMETVASHTGGHVTQINPDEAVAWRAFDLLSTLNSPRLTEIAAKSDGANGPQILLLSNALAHGQELAAVTRVPKGQALPKSLTINGKLNGKEFTQTVQVPESLSTGNSAAQSGHLPRTWARLEIDRLVALGSVEHKQQIIELSKAMYVMSPFTSLLVLETEQMYAQFNVDRGRKDHWAMYAAPAQIPVVSETALANLAPLDAAKERLKLSQARLTTAKSNHERGVAEKRPTADLKRLDRIQRAEQADVKLIEAEIQRIERANTAAADPVNVAWKSVIFRRGAWQSGYIQHHPQYWGYNNWRNRQWMEWEGLQTWNDSFSLDGSFSMPQGLVVLSDGVSDFGTANWETRWTRPLTTQLSLEGIPSLAFTVNGTARTDLPIDAYFKRVDDGVTRLYSLSTFTGAARLDRERFLASDFVATGLGLPSAYYLDDDIQYFPAGPEQKLLNQIRAMERYKFQQRGLLYGEFSELNGRHHFMRRSGPAGPTNLMTKLRQRLHGSTSYFDSDVELQIEGQQRDLGWAYTRLGWDRNWDGSVEFDYDNDGDGVIDGLLTALDSSSGRRYIRLLPGSTRGTLARDGYLPYWTVAVHPLAGVMKDLPSYAPGLQTWQADRLAIVEKSLPDKPERGDVDAAARRLIEKARSLGWETVRLVPREGSRTAPATLVANGAGQFVLNREVGEGLKETVVSDGSTLWHLYAEIGLGAKRTLSRFHQPTIQALIPWYVPSADDLSVGANIKAIGERTIRITGLKPEVDAAKPVVDAKSPKADSPKPHQVAIDLVFAEEGRLIETRVVDVTEGKLLARQTIAADGTVRVLGTKEQLLAEVRYERQAAQAPNLVPQTDGLVVLPLPYRSSTGVPVAVPVNLQTNAADYAKLSDDDALTLLATYFSEARQAELVALIEQRYAARNDHRIGLAVLLASVFPQSPALTNETRHHPDSPLAKFLEQFASWVAPANLNGSMSVGDAASPFLKRLCSVYNHYCNWLTDRAVTRERSAGDIERDLDSLLQFVRDCRALDLATKFLSTAQERLKQHERMNAVFARQLNSAAAKIAEERAIPAFGRTARIEWLLIIGDEPSVAQARDLFRADLGDFTSLGMAPELTSTTRDAFVKHFKTANGQSCGPWSELVREAAEKLVEKDRPFGLIELARRCVALTEPVLAAEIFKLAIKDQDLAAKRELNLAALEYAKEAGNWEQAEACVKRALTDAELNQVAALWRDGAKTAQQLQKFNDWMQRLERAYEIEFAALPKTVNLETFRQDYEALFGQLEQRAEQLADAPQAEKVAFARMIQRAATRWREIDTDDTSPCHRTARMLTKLGLAAAAWNYWTTPLAATPDQSGVWVAFANAMNGEHRFLVADRAWTTAFECEATNPEILLQHAQFLRSANQELRARELLTKITTSNWQPRFDNTKAQAQTMLSQ